jgi:hypothetical protein
VKTLGFVGSRNVVSKTFTSLVQVFIFVYKAFTTLLVKAFFVEKKVFGDTLQSMKEGSELHEKGSTDNRRTCEKK